MSSPEGIQSNESNVASDVELAMPYTVVESWKTLVERGGNNFVTVNESKLEEIAATNPDLVIPDWRIPGLHANNDWAYATQTVVSSVINYAFNDFNVKGGSWSMANPEMPDKQIASSNALHTRMHQVFGEAEDITSNQIFELINRDRFEQFLPEIPMSQSRRRLLGHFASELWYQYEGSVRYLLESTVDKDNQMWAFRANGAGLVDKLIDDNFGEAFEDFDVHDGLSFPFNKRAQLAPLLIHGRALASDTIPRVADIDKIGAIADYQLPRALRSMGAIAYAADLSEHVDSWRPIAAHSQQEIEIRAATYYGTMRIMVLMNEQRAANGQEPVNMAHIDAWLWMMGRKLRATDPDSLPHLTETTTY